MQGVEDFCDIMSFLGVLYKSCTNFHTERKGLDFSIGTFVSFYYFHLVFSAMIVWKLRYFGNEVIVPFLNGMRISSVLLSFYRIMKYQSSLCRRGE